MNDFEAPPSYVKNCLLTKKEKDLLMFSQQGDHLVAHLDGYAVIPIEDYRALAVYKSLWLASASVEK